MKSIIKYLSETNLLRSTDKIPTVPRRSGSWVNTRQTLRDWRNISKAVPTAIKHIPTAIKHTPEIARATSEVWRSSTKPQKTNAGKSTVGGITAQLSKKLLGKGIPMVGPAVSLTNWQMNKMRKQAKTPRST